MKSKRKITVTINRELIKSLDSMTTSRSRFIELMLMNFLVKNGIKTDNIIL